MDSKNSDRDKEPEVLIDRCRIQLGFMILTEIENEILSLKPLSAERFTALIFSAENMNPDHHLSLKRKVKRLFTDQFGNQV